MGVGEGDDFGGSNFPAAVSRRTPHATKTTRQKSGDESEAQRSTTNDE